MGEEDLAESLKRERYRRMQLERRIERLRAMSGRRGRRGRRIVGALRPGMRRLRRKKRERIIKSLTSARFIGRDVGLET